MHIVCFWRFVLLFSTCHTEPSSLQLFHRLCTLSIFSHLRDGDTHTGFLFPAHINCCAEKVFLLSLKGKLITQRCLNFDCQQRKPILIMDSSEGLFWVQKNLSGQTKENTPINIFCNEHTTFFICVNKTICSCWEKL